MSVHNNSASNLEDLQNEVDTAMGTIDADDINLTYLLFKIVQKGRPHDQPMLLQYLAERILYGESSKEIKLDPIIQQDDFIGLRKRYGDLVDALLEMILQDNPPIPEFYARWSELLQNPVLKDERAKVFALHWVLIDKRVPYFQLGEGLRVSNEDWRALEVKLRTERAKLRFILASDFEQISEQADLILKVLDEFDGLERVRLMGTLLWELRDERRRAAAAADLLK